MYLYPPQLIDVEELDTLFTKHLALYTRKQVEEILSSIDTDGSMTLDFIEVVEVSVYGR